MSHISREKQFNLVDADGRKFGAQCHAVEVEISQNAKLWDVTVTAWSNRKPFEYDILRGVTKPEAENAVLMFMRLWPSFFGGS